MFPTKHIFRRTSSRKPGYNIRADLPNLKPYLHPGTQQPVVPDDMTAIFPMALIEQEMTMERYIPIPEEVRELYRAFRPSPLCRAYNLEKALGTPARIYYKYEGNNPSGSHKLNTAIPAGLLQQAGRDPPYRHRNRRRSVGHGGCGRSPDVRAGMYSVHGSRSVISRNPIARESCRHTAPLCSRVRRTLTSAGRAVLEKDPNSMGSLGIAISEAVEDAASHADTNYALGSVLNHVLLHQTVIGLEAMKQMEKIDEYPDMVIGCCGGGSNFGGIAFPFLREKIVNGKKTEIIAVEPAACPTLTKGTFAYDFWGCGRTDSARRDVHTRP